MSKELRIKLRFIPGIDMQLQEASLGKVPGVTVKVRNDERHLISVSLGPNAPTLEELRAIPGVLEAEEEGHFDIDMPMPFPHDHGED